MNDPHAALTRLARLARQRSSLLASLLYDYQELQGLDDEELSSKLGCAVEDLPRLALCKRPRPNIDFRNDVERIAAYSHSDPLRLAQLIRAAESYEVLRGAPQDQSPLLRAARDHDSAGDIGQDKQDDGDERDNE